MRNKLGSVLLLLVTLSCTATGTHAVRPTEFRVIESHFSPGDTIAIEAVLTDDVTMAAGATVRVRGHYRLESQDEALLYFGLTNGSFDSQATEKLRRGEGAFDITHHIVRPGLPHVSLYAVKAGNSIDGVQFEVEKADQ
jgi:hypothetical protein